MTLFTCSRAILVILHVLHCANASPPLLGRDIVHQPGTAFPSINFQYEDGGFSTPEIVLLFCDRLFKHCSDPLISIVPTVHGRRLDIAAAVNDTERLILNTPHTVLWLYAHMNNEVSTPVRWIVAPGASDWSAQFICTSPNSTDIRGSLITTQFSLASNGTVAVTMGVLSVIGLGQYEVYLNGAKVGNAALAPAWTDYTKRLLYDTYDVTTQVTNLPPNSTLSVLLGNGMYNVPDPGSRYTKFIGSSGPKMLLLQLDIHYQNGDIQTVATAADGTWFATDDGPIVYSHTYGGEDYDARLLENPTTFTPAVLCEPPTAEPMQTSAIPATQVMETYSPVSIRTVGPVYDTVTQVDFGINFAGWPTVNLTNLTPGATIKIVPGELLDASGRITQASSGSPMWWSYTASNTILLNETVTYTPHFSFYGFRWVEISGATMGTETVAASYEGASGGSLSIVNASYGANCNPKLQGNEDNNLTIACSTTAPQGYCNYFVNVNVIGDPAPNCAKDYLAFYSCNENIRYTHIPAEANGSTLVLNCSAAPPLPPATVVSIAGLGIRAGLQTVGTFSSDNSLIDAIHNLTLAAFRANLQSINTDCPHREKLGWLETSWLLAPAFAFNFDILDLWIKLSLDTADSQVQAGGDGPPNLVPDISPEYVVFSGGFRDSPEWGSAAIQNRGFLLDWYGSTGAVTPMLNATYATVQTYLSYLLSRRTSAGILDYGLSDWLDVGNVSPMGATATAALILDLQQGATIAKQLNFSADAANYTQLAVETSSAYVAAFYVASPYGTQWFGSQAASSLALMAGIVTNQTIYNEVVAAILSDIAVNGNVTTGGDIGNRFIWEVLGSTAAGTGPYHAQAAEVAAAVLSRVTAPGYGFMVSQGETALAEAWYDTPTDSHIHAMLGHIDEYFYTYLAGIKCSSACTQLVIAPVVLPTVTRINASFHSPSGSISVHHWMECGSDIRDANEPCEGKRWFIDVTVPHGVTASLLSPLSHTNTPLPPGRSMWSDDALAGLVQA
jgi:hypothetical protein